MATVNEKMTAIANAIRDKTGGAEALTLDDMAMDIPKVYEAGKKSQYDEFWDNFQDYGNRTDYEGGFYSTLQGYAGWNDTTFKPKYNIKPVGNCSNMFWRTGITDFTKCGVEIDFSQGTNFYCLFYWSNKCTHIGVVDATNGNGYYSTQSMFSGCRNLVTIDKLIFKDDGSQLAQGVFGYCSKLENIVIEGIIGQNLEIKDCKSLTYESLMSFKNALQDFRGTSTTRTATLHTVSKAKLSENDIAEITQKGWTLA